MASNNSTANAVAIVLFSISILALVQCVYPLPLGGMIIGSAVTILLTWGRQAVFPKDEAAVLAGIVVFWLLLGFASPLAIMILGIVGLAGVGIALAITRRL